MTKQSQNLAESLTLVKDSFTGVVDTSEEFLSGVVDIRKEF
jgi:hypothetical protein